MVAIPAAGVPEVVRAAGRRGCGGLVVFAAGFAEAGSARAAGRAAGGRDRCGPAGDRPELRRARRVPQPRRAVGRRARAAAGRARRARLAERERRGQRDRARARAALPHRRLGRQPGGASTPRRCWRRCARRRTSARSRSSSSPTATARGSTRALARAAERGIGVAVLKVGATAAGATAAAAHTGALAGDQRVFRALVEEAGAAWADDVHDLLELAKALAVPGAPRAPVGASTGLAILTCSGGDSGLGADEAGRRGLPLPPLSPATAARLGAAAAVGGDGRQPARLHRDDLGRARAGGGRSSARSPTTRRSTSCCCSTTSPARWTPGCGRAGTRSATGSRTARPATAPRRSSPRRCPSCCRTTRRPRSWSAACRRSRGCGRRSRAPRRCGARRATRSGCARSPPAVAPGGARRLARRGRGEGAAARRRASRSPPAAWWPTRTTR